MSSFVFILLALGLASAKDCIKEREEANASGMLGKFVPKCNPDGTYKPVQCHEQYCFCVYPKTGEKILGTSVRGLPKSCKLTPCVMARHAGLVQVKMGIMGGFIPRCDAYGDYSPVQCRKGVCWCALPDGKAVKGTQQVGEPKVCKMTDCFKKRHDGLVQLQMGIMGGYIPRCDKNGFYSPLQCRNAMCWCVNKLGKFLKETSNSSPDCKE